MSDRQTQAIFAAIKAFNGGTNTADVNARHGFMAGVVWADANPRPCTITRAGFEKAYEARFMPDPTVALNVLGFLRELGIEVTDDE